MGHTREPRPEGMPIPVQAKDDVALVEDYETASATKVNAVSATPQPASERRDSAGLEELERKSRKHSSSISVDSSTPEVDRSNWPLLYQMIDVNPTTDESEFPEVARR